MPEGFREGHYVLGIEGLALLRAGATRRFGEVEESVREIGEVCGRLDEPAYSQRRDLPEIEVDAGYAGWAESYDDPGNDTIGLEEPVVRALLDELPCGPVLDAACGTGRHAAYLAAAGRDVIGVDASEAMLSRARAKLPRADLRRGELTALPLEDGAVGGAVCALALSHLPELGPALCELARVLRPGGRLVISNPHPLAVGLLGWRAVFTDGAGRRSTIPEYAHLHSDYVSALAAAGFVVRRLVEPRLTREQARARAKAGHGDAFERALTGVPAVLVWEAERSGASARRRR
jgi:SAM-dependent methyltransferase